MTQSDTTGLPRSMPWPATMNQKDYVSALRREAQSRKAEVRRLQAIILATIEEVQRIEALANQLEALKDV